MVPQVMHIGASAALPWNLASRSCDEWISMPTSRAEAAPAPEMTSPACSADLAAARVCRDAGMPLLAVAVATPQAIWRMDESRGPESAIA